MLSQREIPRVVKGSKATKPTPELEWPRQFWAVSTMVAVFCEEVDDSSTASFILD